MASYSRLLLLLLGVYGCTKGWAQSKVRPVSKSHPKPAKKPTPKPPPRTRIVSVSRTKAKAPSKQFPSSRVSKKSPRPPPKPKLVLSSTRKKECTMIRDQYCHAEDLCRSAAAFQYRSNSTMLIANKSTAVFGYAGLTAHNSTVGPSWICAMATNTTKRCSQRPDAKRIFESCSRTNESYWKLSARVSLRLPIEGVPTCALVGSSAALLYARYGPEIDTHDVVIRFNTARVEGYEPIVGTKTSVTVVATHASLLVLNNCGISGRDVFRLGRRCVQTSHLTTAQRLAPDGCCANTRYLVASFSSTLAECMRATCIATTSGFESKSPVAQYVRVSTGARYGSGPYGLALASIISNGPHINLYGFATNQSMKVTPLYHYFERCRHQDRTDGPLDQTAAVISRLPEFFPRFVIREVAPGMYEPYNGSLAEAQICADGLPVQCGYLTCVDKRGPRFNFRNYTAKRPSLSSRSPG